jgi:hypothetical protein
VTERPRSKNRLIEIPHFATGYVVLLMFQGAAVVGLNVKQTLASWFQMKAFASTEISCD